MTVHEKRAKELFEGGYNCAQAVFVAFSDATGIDEKTAFALSSSFGGGMGRMREVCGAVSGMLMVIGALRGSGDKAAHYARVRELMGRFREENGSYVCRELMKLPAGTSGGDPEPRTPEYYKRRPCSELVACAARILDGYLSETEAEQ